MKQGPGLIIYYIVLIIQCKEGRGEGQNMNQDR